MVKQQYNVGNRIEKTAKQKYNWNNFSKIRRITWLRFAIRQKLADSGIIRVWTYEKVGRVIQLESESNTCILDKYGEYFSSRTEVFLFSTIYGLYLKTRLIFDIWLGVE